jgi:1-acyl-sn-glycerol-3-phosphate acyltransferase
MLGFLFHPFLIYTYVALNFILSIWVYNYGKKFYRNKQIPEEFAIKYGKNGDVHLNYPEFRRYDKLNYFRLLFGLIFLFWIRLFLILFLTMGLWLSLKFIVRNNNDKPINESQRYFVVKLTKFFSSLGLLVAGLIPEEKKGRYDHIYTKYLGKDYEITYDKYSAIISNHVSWAEILYYLNSLTPGFISKETAKNFPMIGVIAKKLECLFLDRTNQENRLLVVLLNILHIG